jgi:hypothetical protein
MKALMKDSEGYLLRSKGGISGYAMTRPMGYEQGLWLGPWVAQDSSTAESILKWIVSRFQGKEIRLGALEANPSVRKLLTRYGFKADFKITRMGYGRKMKKGDPAGIYAEAGHEKG